ncbi:hypothetical protein FJR45_09975 [Sulfurimonas sediminis]|uniref:Uncharacterized protein n=1 Tax=Sulfurimonas sediminis TaxID=2590020 RepID=A0A7M1B3E5_9BACT|nr:hypothetical protein [Sulfurimonas sediminis]QOP44253.1 hypothetical protein FJR45_09975 [Sulfurimonas sediminis]
MVGFDKMLFDLNEWLHHMGLLPADYSITGFMFFGDIVIMAILAYGFVKIVMQSGKFEEYSKYADSTTMVSLIIMILHIIGFGIYFHQYAQLLFLATVIVVTLSIATLDMFEGLRKYLDEKIGWLF